MTEPDEPKRLPSAPLPNHIVAAITHAAQQYMADLVVLLPLLVGVERDRTAEGTKKTPRTK